MSNKAWKPADGWVPLNIQWAHRLEARYNGAASYVVPLRRAVLPADENPGVSQIGQGDILIRKEEDRVGASTRHEAATVFTYRLLVRDSQTTYYDDPPRLGMRLYRQKSRRGLQRVFDAGSRAGSAVALDNAWKRGRLVPLPRDPYLAGWLGEQLLRYSREAISGLKHADFVCWLTWRSASGWRVRVYYRDVWIAERRRKTLFDSRASSERGKWPEEAPPREWIAAQPRSHIGGCMIADALSLWLGDTFYPVFQGDLVPLRVSRTPTERVFTPVSEGEISATLDGTVGFSRFVPDPTASTRIFGAAPDLGESEDVGGANPSTPRWTKTKHRKGSKRGEKAEKRQKKRQAKQQRADLGLKSDYRPAWQERSEDGDDYLPDSAIDD